VYICNSSYFAGGGRRISYKAGLGKATTLSEKQTKRKSARCMVQVIEHLLASSRPWVQFKVLEKKITGQTLRLFPLVAGLGGSITLSHLGSVCGMT
jgi:hypothetical protein